MLIRFLVHSSSNNKSLPSSVLINSARRPSGPFLLKLGNPPSGRRTNINGTNSTNSLSAKLSNVSSTEDSSPPPIPPRTFLNNSTNKFVSNQDDHQQVRPTIKLKSNLRRSRPVQRREAKTTNYSDRTQTARADSADPLPTSTAKFDFSHRNRRDAILIDGGANSD